MREIVRQVARRALLPTVALLGLGAGIGMVQEADAGCPLEKGEKVYRLACAACHDSGTGGAQVIGDREGWRSRLDKGMDMLVRHSIDGFSGAVGDMPPRGGHPQLSDAEVEAAVCYLLEQSR